MNLVQRLFIERSRAARARRAAQFRSAFDLQPNTRILDLGSETGANIHAVLQGTPVRPQNVYIADIDADAVRTGQDRYGYVPVVIGESGRLPFRDGYFDIVYCSSVIEHVTVAKDEVWTLRRGDEFRRRARQRQRDFAREIRRLGRQYYVQTPYRHFPVESHSWLPFVAWLPRPWLIDTLRIANRVWVKQTRPDWHLLDRRELYALFDDAQQRAERFLGLTKSLIAIRSQRLDPPRAGAAAPCRAR